MTKEAKTKGEMLLAGFTQTVNSDDEVRDILNYVKGVLKTTHHLDWNTDEVMKDSVKYCKEYEYKAINIVTLEGMILIALVLKTDEDPDNWSLTAPDGVLAYVYNATCPSCSELGYTFFENIKGLVKRVG